jgi:hypothetical protein
MDFTKHNDVIQKVFREYETLPNEVYCEILDKKIEVLAGLSHSLHLDKILMAPWKSYNETFIVKICFHISSLLTLCKGTKLPFSVTKEKVIIFDEPSILTLLRTITETYLTFYYLFVAQVPEEEKHFRFLVYEYCGLKQRQSFPVSLPAHKKKLEEEAIYVQSLKSKIVESLFFQKEDKRVQNKIIEGIKPRLKSWKSLIKEAGLKLGMDENLYSFKSSYTHSEYLSVLQIKGNNYGYKPFMRKSYYVLFIIHMLVCRVIINLKNMFPTIKSHFDELEKNLQIEIEFLSVNLVIDADSLRKEGE